DHGNGMWDHLHVSTEPAYALLILTTGESQLGVRHDLDADTFSVVGKLSAILEDEDPPTWSQWIGSLGWDELTDVHRYVLTQAPDDAPRVSNSATKRMLWNRLELTWRSAQL